MKPTHERNQECLPPKKRDLPVSSTSSGTGGGGGAGASGGDEGTPTHSSIATCSESQGGGTTPGEWMRVQSSLQYSAENADGISVPVDQYSMLYKVALPSVTYSPTNLHPVLSHISPAYTVPSPLLQHPGIPYSPLGYAQIPHSSLQFVSSPYAVPYAVPPGFVPSSLISQQSAIPQGPHVSHLVPYPSVIQEGVVSPASQPPTSAHAFAKVAAAGSVPLVLAPEQAAAQQHLGPGGGLAAGEVSPRGVTAFYHHPGSRAVSVSTATAYREARGTQEVNGGEEGRGGRELLQDSVYSPRGVRPAHVAPGSSAADSPQDRPLGARRYEERGSPGRRSTPDTDLEVQQVVGRLTSPNQGMSGGHKEEPLGPLNLSQSSQRSWQALPAACVENMVGLGKPLYEAHPAGAGDPRVAIHQQLAQPARHAVMLANGQPVLVPLDYKQQQHYASLTNDVVTTAAVMPVKHSKAFDSPAQMHPPDRAPVELAHQQLQVQPGPAVPVPVPLALPVPVQSQAPPSLTQNPSHFMKGAIIQLATGELKRVEDLQTQDFVRSAEVSGGLKIDSSMVVDIRKSQQKPGLMTLHFTVGEQQNKVTIDVPPEHPFFVFGQGWSSCSPEGTAKLYGLACHHLQVGDVCVSIALQQPQRQEKPLLQQQQQSSRTPTKVSSTTSVITQSMGPPAPQHLRPPAQCRAESSHRERERGEEEEEPMQVRGGGHGDTPSRPDRTSAEHTRSLSSNYLHTEGSPRTVAAMRGLSSSIIGAQRHWSVPSFQRYGTMDEEEAHLSSSGSSRPSFIPQEVKLSIEGRSNAGK
ncbi:ataxin-1-like [Anguilla anguilla]|uniref:ataxin-1-like n=1 Tax=Anguilla anguilla TaxID=7936 RepID=UPI0015AA9F03|nr:ataxin-1-like [Anguilla anguilla]